MSLEMPDRPSRPLFLFSISSLCVAVSFSVRSRKASTPASTSPQRVPMISPSAGVKPIVVSTERPWSTAQSDEPLPRWQLTSRSSFGRRFRNCAARRLT